MNLEQWVSTNGDFSPGDFGPFGEAFWVDVTSGIGKQGSRQVVGGD